MSRTYAELKVAHAATGFVDFTAEEMEFYLQAELNSDRQQAANTAFANLANVAPDYDALTRGYDEMLAADRETAERVNAAMLSRYGVE